jgi:hypothetical protein
METVTILMRSQSIMSSAGNRTSQAGPGHLRSTNWGTIFTAMSVPGVSGSENATWLVVEPGFSYQPDSELGPTSND